MTGMFVAALIGFAASQIGYLWSFEELTAKADLVVIAEPLGTDETGPRTDHPELRPALPALILTTSLNVLAVLKSDARATSPAMAQLRLTHYRIDWDESRRRNPPQPAMPPPGVMNAGSVLDFSRAPGPYLLFLRRGAGGNYEPLSGHTFPTSSVFLLGKVGR